MLVKVSARTFTDRPIPDSKVHGANKGPIYGRQHPGGSHAGPMNYAIWDAMIIWNLDNYQ